MRRSLAFPRPCRTCRTFFLFYTREGLRVAQEGRVYAKGDAKWFGTYGRFGKCSIFFTSPPPGLRRTSRGFGWQGLRRGGEEQARYGSDTSRSAPVGNSQGLWASRRPAASCRQWTGRPSGRGGQRGDTREGPRLGAFRRQPGGSALRPSGQEAWTAAGPACVCGDRPADRDAERAGSRHTGIRE